MSTSLVERPRAADAFGVWGARCAIAGGGLLLVGGVVGQQVPASSAVHGPLAGVSSLTQLLLLVAIVGLARSGALGGGRLARAGAALSVLGFATNAAAEIVNLASADVANICFGIGTLAVAAGLILVGAACLQNRRWTGWHRFTPLAAGLFLVVVVFPSFALPGSDFEYAIAAWGVCFVVLGIAMRAEAP